MRSLDKQPRKDYAELLQLSAIFLGDETSVTFKTPGAVHKARWMAKAIYVVKMYLLRKQLPLSINLKNNLRRMATFIVFVYIKYWFKTPLPIEAPETDIQFLKNLSEFKDFDPNLAEAVISKFTNHLWYLSKELVCLSLFSKNVDFSEKK